MKELDHKQIWSIFIVQAEVRAGSYFTRRIKKAFLIQLLIRNRDVFNVTVYCILN